MLSVYIMRAIVMLLVIPAHEAAHAFVSYRLGDSTAKDYGRMTLNPVAHFDPWGALCMIVAGIGWAKPVPADVRRFRNPKRDMAISAAAGPLCNLLLAYFGMIFYKLCWYLIDNQLIWQYSVQFFSVFIMLNISLAVFNLIPIPPFDGSRILLVFLPTKLYFGFMRYERFVMMAVLFAVLVGLFDVPLYYMNRFVQNLLWAATGFVEPMLRLIV